MKRPSRANTRLRPCPSGKRRNRSKRIAALVLGDYKNITRDPMLIMMSFALLLIILLVRTVLPDLTAFLREDLGFNLFPYYSFIAGFLTLITPMLFGTVMGFVLLDERDEGILTYISVTPLRKRGFLLYRLFLPVIFSVLCSLLFLGTTLLIPFSFCWLLPITVVASLEAPMLTLFLAAFADNKVEGLALAKGMGILYIAPFIGRFVESNWQLLAGISPPYWITKAVEAFWAGATSGINTNSGTMTASCQDPVSFWFYITGGLIVHLVVICLLVKRFEQ